MTTTSDLQICKDWFSFCDKIEQPNPEKADLNTIYKKIKEWNPDFKDPPILTINIKKAAEEMGFKRGCRLKNYYEFVREEETNRRGWTRQVIKKKVDYRERVSCFNISSMSLPFRKHLHPDEKIIDYHYYYNPRKEGIQLIHNIIQKKFYWGGLQFQMTDPKTGYIYNCRSDNEYLYVQNRNNMWNSPRHHDYISDPLEKTTHISSQNLAYLEALDNIVKCTENDFLLECEEHVLRNV